jgi:hypothetical protein
MRVECQRDQRDHVAEEYRQDALPPAHACDAISHAFREGTNGIGFCKYKKYYFFLNWDRLDRVCLSDALNSTQFVPVGHMIRCAYILVTSPVTFATGVWPADVVDKQTYCIMCKYIDKPVRPVFNTV